MPLQIRADVIAEMNGPQVLRRHDACRENVTGLNGSRLGSNNDLRAARLDSKHDALKVPAVREGCERRTCNCHDTGKHPDEIPQIRCPRSLGTPLLDGR